MKRVAILGAGISGLALAYFLKQRFGNQLEISLLEKSERPGGWIQTLKDQEFFFELGPRSLRTGERGRLTWQLIEQLGLKSEVITPTPSSAKKFLYTHGKLQALSTGFSLMTLSALLRDIVAFRGKGEDESVANFCQRRFGKKITETVADPMGVGIFSGDIHKLSMRSCFPTFYQREKKFRSLFLSYLFQREHKASAPFFSFKGGMEQLVERLKEELISSLHLVSEVIALRAYPEGVGVEVRGRGELFFDRVFSTLSAQTLAPLMAENSELVTKLSSFESNSLSIVSLGYRENLLKEEGFGHLVPTKEGSKLLGVVWDSSAFPQHNSSPHETRLSVMLGGDACNEVAALSKEEVIALALSGVSEQLGIDRSPDFVNLHLAKNAIPQYRVGHYQKVEEIYRLCSRFSPFFVPLGISFEGVSVNDCIAKAYQIASEA